jgi:hypothetical protein
MSKKAFMVTVIISVLLTSLTAITVANAQSIPKPSIPEFTLRLVDNSYYLSPTPAYPSGEVQNIKIEIIIRNQQFTPFYSTETRNQMINLYYYISYKEHYEATWTYYPSDIFSRNSHEATNVQQSNSDYTVVSFKAPTEGGQMDFRVQAQAGYYDEKVEFIAVPGAPFSVYSFVGEVSGWTATQTISITPDTTSATPTLLPTATTTLTPVPTEFPTPTSSPIITPSPPQPISQGGVPVWLYAVTAAMALATGVLVGVVAMMRRRSKEAEPN